MLERTLNGSGQRVVERLILTKAPAPALGAAAAADDLEEWFSQTPSYVARSDDDDDRPYKRARTEQAPAATIDSAHKWSPPDD